MAVIPLDPRTALFMLGCVYLLMSSLVWAVLRRHHDQTAAGLWSGGGVLVGLAYALFSMRGAVPDALSVGLANAVSFLGLGLRAGALQYEREPAPRRWLPALWLVGLATGVSLLAALAGEVPRRIVNTLLLVLFSGWLAWLAHRVTLASASRAAGLISGSYAFLAASLLFRVVMQALSGGYGLPVFFPSVDFGLVLAGGLAAAIFGNVGYLGMALDAVQARREAQARDLLHEQAQRNAAEANATALRERLAEREEFVRVLAHEVRQPLNNASAALQAAGAALHAQAAGDRREAALRLQRAQTVIGHIVGAIDNTLAATALLTSPRPLALRDADVQVLIELSLGDLDPAQRARVQLGPPGHARTAPLDIGMMRLALRNLLANALAYSPADAPVHLRVSDTDEPLGLVFEVADRGPGIDAALAGRLFERGARGTHGLPGHGLGLYVVRQIMRRHGGQASWRPADDGPGSVFRLWLPAAG